MSSTSKYRYLIYDDNNHGTKTNQKVYTVEEAHWNETEHRFENEIIETVKSSIVKTLAGYLPHTCGERAIEVWLVFPPALHKDIKNQSPLEIIRHQKKNKHPFHPFSLPTLRRVVTLDEWPEYHVHDFNRP